MFVCVCVDNIKMLHMKAFQRIYKQRVYCFSSAAKASGFTFRSPSWIVWNFIAKEMWKVVFETYPIVKCGYVLIDRLGFKPACKVLGASDMQIELYPWHQTNLHCGCVGLGGPSTCLAGDTACRWVVCTASVETLGLSYGLTAHRCTQPSPG